MSYLQHIQQCNQYRPDRFIPFIFAESTIGEVKLPFARQLISLSKAFSIDNNSLKWSPSKTDFSSLNLAMSELTEMLVKVKLVSYRHDELYPVTTGNRDQALFLMDRAVVPYFGVAAFGQHLNGFVRSNGNIFMWIARRSQHKRHAPGKLDNLVAGGLPWGLKPEQNLAKECWEEAAIPADVAAQALAVGSISYRCETEAGVKPDTMFCYDLELAEDFIPRCTDGEVEEFQLQPLDKIAQIVHDSNDFKLNCNLAIIDFLIRHGYITSEHPEYQDLIQGLAC